MYRNRRAPFVNFRQFRKDLVSPLLNQEMQMALRIEIFIMDLDKRRVLPKDIQL